MPTKTWAVGEELLAADMNTYVQQQVVATFANLGALKTAWPAPPDGARAYLTDEQSELVARAGTWRWWHKEFDFANGNRPWITWAAVAVAASSGSMVTLSGRTLHLSFYIQPTTPAVSGNIKYGTLLAPYLPNTTSVEGAAVTAGSGVPGSARILCRANGDFQSVFGGGGGTNATAIIGVANWQLADLVPA